MKRNARLVPIVTYHGLTQGHSVGNGLYTLTRAQFEAQMAYLRQEDFHAVPLEAVTRWLKGEPLPEKSIVITFDDGRESDVSVAMPTLKRYGFRAIFFVNPATLNQGGYLTTEQLRQIRREGMEIGSHGYDHLFLTQLDEKALRHQVTGAQERLQQLLQEEVLFFSIPRGRYNRRVLEAVRETGYRAACTSDVGFNQQDSNPLQLKRWAIRRSYSLDDFISIVEGKPKGTLLFDYALKQTAHRLLGHRLYEAIRQRVLKGETV